MWILGFAILTLVVVLPLFLRRRRKPFSFDLTEIILPIIAYLYLGMGLRGLLLCTGLQETPFKEVYDTLLKDPVAPLSVFLVTALGVTCLYAGYFFPRKHKLSASIANSQIFAGPHSRQRMYALCAACGLIAAAGAFHLWRTYGWQDDPSMRPEAFIERTAQGGLYLTTGLQRFAFIGVLISAGLMAKYGDAKARLVWALNVAVIVCWFLLTSEKESLFTLVLGLVIIRNYTKKRVGARSLLLAALALLLLYPVLVVYRYIGLDMLRDPAPEHFAGPDLLLQRSHHFDLTLLIVDRVKGWDDLKYGSSLTEITYFFIPRAIWPGKPLSFGYRFGAEYTPAEFQIGETGGETPSLVGELFLNGHIVGVACGMFLFGAFLKSIYVFLRTAPLSPVKAATYALFVLDAVHVVEGPIASHMSTFIVDMLPILFIGVVATHFSRAAIVQHKPSNSGLLPAN